MLVSSQTWCCCEALAFNNGAVSCCRGAKKAKEPLCYVESWKIRGVAIWVACEKEVELCCDCESGNRAWPTKGERARLSFDSACDSQSKWKQWGTMLHLVNVKVLFASREDTGIGLCSIRWLLRTCLRSERRHRPKIEMRLIWTYLTQGHQAAGTQTQVCKRLIRDRDQKTHYCIFPFGPHD